MVRRSMPVFAKLLLVVFAAGIAFVLSSAWKEMQRSKRIEDEVSKLRTEAERIRNENRTLSERITYFSTPEFEEREAKEKLGMKRKDEEIVSIEAKGLEETAPDKAPPVPSYRPDLPNYRKWWELFGGR